MSEKNSLPSEDKIVLQFSTKAGVASAVLHWFDHSWCSHVDVVYDDEKFPLFGAMLLGGVTFRPNQGFIKTLRVELPTTKTIKMEFDHFMVCQKGKPYDLNGIWSFAINRDWREDDTWYCSELIAAGLEKSGFLKYPLYTDQITPQELLLICNMFVPIGEPVATI